MGTFKAQTSLVSSQKAGQRTRGKGFLQICRLVDAALIRIFGDKASRNIGIFFLNARGIALGESH